MLRPYFLAALPIPMILTVALYGLVAHGGSEDEATKIEGVVVDGRLIGTPEGEGLVIPTDLSPVAHATVSIPSLGVEVMSDEAGEFEIDIAGISEPYLKADVVVEAEGFGGWQFVDYPIRPDVENRLYVELSTNDQTVEGHTPVEERAERSDNQGTPASVDSSCSGYFSDDSPPLTIRVWRRWAGENFVRTYDFNFYAKNVLPVEWYSSWPAESLKAGATAVKNYGWYWVNYWRGGIAPDGSCYDVDDTDSYQVFVPGSQTSSTDSAVDAIWGWTTKKYGAVFQTNYRDTLTGDQNEDCGAGADGYRMSQWGTRQCANAGYGWQQIVTTYYYPGVTFTPPATPTPTPSPTPVPCVDPGGVVDGGLYREEHDDAVYITWDGRKYWLVSEETFLEMGYHWEDVVCVPDGYLDGIPGTPREETLFRGYDAVTNAWTYYVFDCSYAFAMPDQYVSQMTDNDYVHNDSPYLVASAVLLSVDWPSPVDGCYVTYHGSPADWGYLVCNDPAAGPYTRWTVFDPYYIDVFGLENGDLRTLWSGALDNVPILGRTALRDACFDWDWDWKLYRQHDGQWILDPFPPDFAVAWSDLAERLNGTDPHLRCAVTATANDEGPPDAWPVDLDDNQFVDGSDVLKFGGHMGSHVGDPNYDERLDFDTNGLVDGADVLKFGVFFQARCEPPAGDGPGEPEEPSEFEPVEVAIDANVEGDSANSANYLGSREECGAASSKAVASGTSTGDNSETTLNDKGATFGSGLANYGVRITGGTGTGQVRLIVSSSETQLVVSPAWDTAPDDSSAYEVVATVQADITVESLAGFDADAHKGGIAGFGLNLHFDPEAVAVIGVNPDGDSNTILAAGGTRIPFDVIGPLPATGGNIRIDMLDLSQTFESGSGVLVRLVLMPLAPGGSALSLSDVVVFEAGTTKYEIGSLLGAEIRADSACDS